MSERRTDIPQIRALALLGEQFDLALDRVDAAETAKAARRARRGWTIALPRPRAARTAIAVAMACIAALLVYSLAIDTGRTPAPAEALADVSSVARLQPLPADDQFTYTRATIVSRRAPVQPIGSGHEEDAPGAPVLITSDRRAWISVSRPGVVVDRATSVKAADPNGTVDPALRERALGGPNNFERPKLGSYRLGSRNYTRATIVRQPTDPQAIISRLKADLRDTKPDQRSASLWAAITRSLTLESAPLPPKLRAGLIDSLALVPGVEVAGDRNVGGRPGRAFSLDSGGVKQTVVFDTETAEVLLSTTTVSTSDAAGAFEQPVGSLLESYELVESGIVDSIPDTAEQISGG